MEIVAVGVAVDRSKGLGSEAFKALPEGMMWMARSLHRSRVTSGFLPCSNHPASPCRLLRPLQ
jgi:hypothetical protein